MYKQNQQKEKIQNKFFVLQNDFSTLYTKIPHGKLLDILYKVVDFVFKVGNRDYILINKQGLCIMVI